MYSLIKEAQNGSREAMDSIIRDNGGLVRSIVTRFLGRGYDAEDLCQIGMIGLVKAVRRFDTSYDVKFSTYAVPLITGEIKRFLRDDGLIKVSRRYKEIALKARLETESYIKESGREPTIGELADALEVDVYTLTEAMESVRECESIYRTVAEEGRGEMYLIDKLSGEESLTVTDRISLNFAVAALDKHQRQIIAYRYFMDETQTTVAKRLGISQVQVSRIEKKALCALREKLKDCC